MNDTYTMSIARTDGSEEIVAHGVSAARALNIALEHGGAGRAVLVADIGADHVLWELLLEKPGGNRHKVMETRTPRTTSHLSDAEEAVSAFGQAFLDDVGAHWRGGIVRGEDFVRRYRGRGDAS